MPSIARGRATGHRPHLARSALALIAIVAVLAGACTRSSSDGDAATTPATEPAPQTGGALVWAIPNTLDTFLPSAARWTPSSYPVIKALYDPLLAFDADNHLRPYLLRSLDPITDDLTTWRMEVRSDVRFSDGTPFDANALVANLAALRASPITSAPFRPISQLRKTSELAIEITFDQPWANFPAMLTTQAGFFVAPAQLQGGAGAAPIGAGAFVLAQGEAASTSLTLRRNQNYWQRGLPYLDEVRIRVIADADSRRAALNAGDADVMFTWTPADVARLRTGDVPFHTTVRIDSSTPPTFTGIVNTQSGPLVDRRLRTALARATDKQALVRTLFSDAFPVATSPYGGDNPWNVGPPDPPPDADEARRLVADWRNEHPGEEPTIDLVIIANGEDLAIAQVLQQQWQDVGFTVSIAGSDPASYTTRLIGGDFDVTVTNFAWWPEPDANYPFWSATSIGAEGAISLNFPRFGDDAVEAALQQGRRAVDPATRADAYRSLFGHWAEEGVYLWLFHAPYALVASNRVQGLDETPGPDGGTLPQVTFSEPFLSSVWIEQS